MAGNFTFANVVELPTYMHMVTSMQSLAACSMLYGLVKETL